MDAYEREIADDEKSRRDETQDRLAIFDEYVRTRGYEVMMKHFDAETERCLRALAGSADPHAVLKLAGKIEALMLYRRYAEDNIKACRMQLGEA